MLLIGPAGAGKTTVARHWARRRPVPTAHISLDDVREWVCSGFADPQTGWNDQSETQYRLARRTCGFAARNFLANGISCILDDAVFPDRPVVGLGGWKRHVGPGLLPVVLLPGLEVVLERNAERSGNRRLSDEEVAGIHGRMAGWYGSGLPIIDNSRCDVETTARVLDDVLARALKSPRPGRRGARRGRRAPRPGLPGPGPGAPAAPRGAERRERAEAASRGGGAPPEGPRTDAFNRPDRLRPLRLVPCPRCSPSAAAGCATVVSRPGAPRP
ncbi:AAA family ATPase [Streptomyces sp. I6]|uniref:AAA family ATPase n=1 Tax=Streptomyces sp. I6 TaxID=2483113 RepID=UPI0037DA1652